MSDHDKNPTPGGGGTAEDPERMEVKIGYGQGSQVSTQDGKDELSLSGNIYRTPVRFRGKIVSLACAKSWHGISVH